MKMNKTRSPKKTVTLSIVLNMTTSWYLSAGMNLTSFNILNNRKVLSTDSPPLPSWNSSRTLNLLIINLTKP